MIRGSYVPNLVKIGPYITSQSCPQTPDGSRRVLVGVVADKTLNTADNMRGVYVHNSKIFLVIKYTYRLGSCLIVSMFVRSVSLLSVLGCWIIKDGNSNCAGAKSREN